MDERLQKAIKINSLFEVFVSKVEQEVTATDSNAEFLKGYRQCLTDILSGLDSEEDTEMMMLIRSKVETDTKKEIYKEVLSGISAIQSGFKKALGE
jgi:hypothetical protein